MKEALTKQKDRMDTAFATEQSERRARREGRAGGVLGKHPADAESSLDAMKRAKIEPVEPMNVAFPGPPIVATGREIDISPLPERFVIDAVMRGLQAISAEALTRILEVSAS
jgi:symplekin